MNAKLISLEYPERSPLPKTYDELRDEYRARKERQDSGEGVLLTFRGLPEGKDAYNPTGPFSVGVDTYQWVRVESRRAQDAVSVLFRQVGEYEYEAVSAPEPLPLEDPFITSIGNTLVLGGVELRKDEHGLIIGYRTLFYTGTSLDALSLFSCGPELMKDIRMAPLQNGSIFIFTRPYVPELGHIVGRVAVTCISELEELAFERLEVGETELIPNLFAPAEWGGVNDAYFLPNGLIGALCHVSKYDELGKRHYAAAAFVFDPINKMCTPLTLIAERMDFPMGPVKIMPKYLDLPEMHDDLADVIFPARLTPITGKIHSSPTLKLTAGLSDAATGALPVPNPFPELCQMFDV